MVNNLLQPSTANIRFTWQAMLWRLLLTALLLLILIGSNLTIFSAVTSQPDAPPLSTQPQEVGIEQPSYAKP